VFKTWFNEEAMTNILIFAKVLDHFPITYNNENRVNKFNVHLTDGKKIPFVLRSENNLYFYKPSTKDVLEGNIFLNTFKENKEFHTEREFKRAKRAQDFFHAMGSPLIPDLMAILCMNLVKDNPIRIEDIKLAKDIFGPDVATLKGKTTRRKPLPVVENYIIVPRELIQAPQHVTLAKDGMTINGLKFPATISKNIYYWTVQYIPTNIVEIYREIIRSLVVMYIIKVVS
jgi:hypothetical protein